MTARVPLVDRRWIRVTLLGAVAGFGTALRLLGIRMGLPFHHHWDEGWIADSAADMLRHGNDVPRSYQYGAPLMRLTELAFRLLHGWSVPVDLTPEDAQVTLFLLARIVTAALASTGTVAIYGAALSSEPSRPRATRVALASAAMYAAAWELVLHSRYAVTDACLVALVAWTLAFAGKYVATRRLRWAFASVFAAGVTTAFKVPGVATVVIPIAALWVVPAASFRRRSAVRRLALVVGALALVVLVFVVFNPHVVDHAGSATSQIIGRIRQTRDGGASSVYVRRPGLPHLASALWAIAIHFMHRSALPSLVLTGVAVAGLASAVRQKRTLVTIALVHAVVVTLSVALPNRVFWIRNYLVVTPCLCLGFGHGFVGLVAKLRARLAAHPRGRGLALATLGVATALALGVTPLAYALGAQSREVDPRVQALAWIARASPPDDDAIQVGLTPGVFGKAAVGGYAGVRDLVVHPRLQLEGELEACPVAGGPPYIVDASYRDTHRADSADPYGDVWLFEACPGYERAAVFESDPYEFDVDTMATWLGRVSVVVLRRTDR